MTGGRAARRSLALMPSRRVAIVPHTHWDREWYEPFQTFRLDLVRLFDGLLDLLEADPSYRHFMVDGQVAALDDYLEVRPEAEARIRALCAAGRLAIGPWYVLMDEFLVSGETIVRDLQMGMERGAAFGGTMDVGYLPDMFGHIAQMPQILHAAGIQHAVVWRGVPTAVTTTGFWWSSPDGSTVRAEYLPVGYGNAASLPQDAASFVRRIRDHEQEVAGFLLDGLLCMNGSDHLQPQPALGRVVAEANALQDELRFSIVSLPEYLADAPTTGLLTWHGELRSGARANMLMGVTSNRVDVKDAACRAELALERRAEPYAALFLPTASWPGRLIDLAWLGVVRNAAHDSICACSVDEVVDAVLQRYAESRQIADGVARRALEALSRSMATAGPVVVNPSARPRSGLVELVVAAQDPPGPDVQVVSERGGLPGSITLDAGTVRTVLGMLQGPRIDDDAWVHEVSIDEDDTGIDVVVTVGPDERPDVPIAQAKQDLYTRLGARPDAAVRVRLDQPPIRRIVAIAQEVPGFGWRAFEPRRLAHPVVTSDDGGATELSNGLVTVTIDAADGTFAVDGTPGFGRLVDGGDLGDSYNYSPPGTDRVVDAPVSVDVSLSEQGPVRGRAEVAAVYPWPDHVDGSTQTRVGTHDVAVTTTIELRADDPQVRVWTRFVNPSRDHRVRVHLPLPHPADCSRAETAFGDVVRGLDAEGRAEERGLPTFPARRFVAAGGLVVCHEAVHEYELIDRHPSPHGEQATVLALTVLRATGMLSRLGMTYRPLPAGPMTPVDGLQLVGRTVDIRYGVAIGDHDPWAMADDLLLPLEVVPSFGGGWRPNHGSELEVRGAQVSAVRRVAGGLEVRVFNPTDRATAVELPGRSGWLVDLRGRPWQAVDDGFELHPFGIATVRLGATEA
jgi:hypothetical protein